MTLLSTPSACLKLLGFLSLNTSPAQYRVEYSPICSSMGLRFLAFSINSYSTLNGIYAWTCLLIRPSRSISLILRERVFELIPSTESNSSLKRVLLYSIMSRRIRMVNFLPIRSNVLCIGQFFRLDGFRLPAFHQPTILLFSG